MKFRTLRIYVASLPLSLYFRLLLLEVITTQKKKTIKLTVEPKVMLNYYLFQVGTNRQS